MAPDVIPVPVDVGVDSLLERDLSTPVWERRSIDLLAAHGVPVAYTRCPSVARGRSHTSSRMGITVRETQSDANYN